MPASPQVQAQFSILVASIELPVSGIETDLLGLAHVADGAAIAAVAEASNGEEK